MKQAEIIKVIAQELGSSDIAELNKILKADESRSTKFRLTGKKLPALGYTVAIKIIADEGLKIFDVNKVTLVRYADIETFAKAKPKSERPVRPAKVKVEEPKKVKASKAAKAEEVEPEETEDFESQFLRPEKFRKKTKGKAGSSFIPVTSPKKKN